MRDFLEWIIKEVFNINNWFVIEKVEPEPEPVQEPVKEEELPNSVTITCTKTIKKEYGYICFSATYVDGKFSFGQFTKRNKEEHAKYGPSMYYPTDSIITLSNEEDWKDFLRALQAISEEVPA